LKVQVVKWGNSLAVRIPKPIADRARFQEGDLLEIEASAEGIELQRPSGVPTLTQLVSEITPENRYPEVSSEYEIGGEAVEW
jgi:Growth regulator